MLNPLITPMLGKAPTPTAALSRPGVVKGSSALVALDVEKPRHACSARCA